MNEKNLDYLKEGLKYMGFGTNLNAELERQVQSQQPEFRLSLQLPHHNSTMDYTLHFRRSDQSDMYFFNKYEATLKPDDSARQVSQTFYINKNSGITAKEAYNLLNGRSVHKDLVNTESQPYKAWLQLDPQAQDQQGNHKVKQFHENYGFDLEKTLRQFAIKELEDPQQKERLLRSLERGNQQQVTAVQNGQETKRFIEASPQYKTINVFDEQLKPVKRETILRQEPQQAQRKETKQELLAEGQQELKPVRRKGLAI
ncbi:hypothetical protein CLV24_13925 [Pontibacter ummariensis]|uniref:DUF3945 domain-containing protein n=1 Tax=Pontibacter ummariensis TaxID=1610492 RepID=A0A239LEH6_9BACT|nr:hypothetical protein [Pontibacter ummariensis]PRY03677.1 hypothetical protein CLV24_13925 [Pontibacter ummariensis]SNT28039.1 hypothetical protein SAMN06296052_1397 [Pontibacter ummariensis]